MYYNYNGNFCANFGDELIMKKILRQLTSKITLITLHIII